MNIWNKRDHPQVDLEYAKLISWGIKNLTQREKELIYIFYNFDRAYLTQKEIEAGKDPCEFDKKVNEKVKKYMLNQNINFKKQGE